MVDALPLGIQAATELEPAAPAEPLGPLVALEEMLRWAQRPMPADPSFASDILDAASLVVREAGDSAWTATTAPSRAKLICKLLAANYYKNPDQLISESIGPISERRVDDIVRGMNLTDEEKALLAELAGKTFTDPASGAGELWVMQTTRGAVETDPLPAQVAGTYYAFDSNGVLFPWIAAGDPLEPPGLPGYPA